MGGFGPELKHRALFFDEPGGGAMQVGVEVGTHQHGGNLLLHNPPDSAFLAPNRVRPALPSQGWAALFARASAPHVPRKRLRHPQVSCGRWQRNDEGVAGRRMNASGAGSLVSLRGPAKNAA